MNKEEREKERERKAGFYPYKTIDPNSKEGRDGNLGGDLRFAQ